MIDKVHGRPDGTAGRTFREHRDEFIDGVDYYLLKTDEFRRLSETTADAVIRRPDVYVMTESGYLMIVKSLQDKLAWQVHRMLVQSYFQLRQEAKVGLNDPAALRQALLSYSEKVIALETTVAEQKPKAEFHDATPGVAQTASRIAVSGVTASAASYRPPAAPSTARASFRRVRSATAPALSYRHAAGVPALRARFPRTSREPVPESGVHPIGGCTLSRHRPFLAKTR